MPSSLISEKSLVISPTLAATIGLEEALMLQLLHEFAVYDHELPDGWHLFAKQRLLELLPFWSERDCQRILASLSSLGIVSLDSAPLEQSQTLRFRLDKSPSAAQVRETVPAQPPARKLQPAVGGKSLIAPRWEPQSDLYRQLELHGIPIEFAKQQLDEFVLYWSDRGEPAYSWNSKFRAQVIRRWRELRHSPTPQQQGPEAMSAGWYPSEDALEILERANVDPDFIDEAIPEFVLYWSERGDVARTWNSRFISHVRRQWARYSATVENDSEPRPLPAQWQPSADLWDVIRLANIDPGFAKGLLPEFQIYWTDCGEAHSSWNSKFLRHVKYHWARSHQLGIEDRTGDGKRQRPAGTGSTRSRSLSEDLADRSWAG